MLLYLKKYWRHLQDPIQPTTAKMNTADGSPMTALGKTALHLRIAKFKFTHNFVICDKTSGYRDYFWHRHTKEFFSFIHLG